MKTITDYFSKKYNRKFPLLVADLLSTLPLYYLFNYVQMGLHTQQYGMYAKILSLTILSELCMKMLKKIPVSSAWGPFLYRPKKSCNTDLLSSNGPTPPQTVGFPSGHVLTTTLFSCFYLWILRKQVSNWKELFHRNPLSVLFYCSLPFVMMWVRVYKQCHNPFQVLGGLLSGLLIFYLFTKL